MATWYWTDFKKAQLVQFKNIQGKFKFRKTDRHRNISHASTAVNSLVLPNWVWLYVCKTDMNFIQILSAYILNQRTLTALFFWNLKKNLIKLLWWHWLINYIGFKSTILWYSSIFCIIPTTQSQIFPNCFSVWLPFPTPCFSWTSFILQTYKVFTYHF